MKYCSVQDLSNKDLGLLLTYCLDKGLHHDERFVRYVGQEEKHYWVSDKVGEISCAPWQVFKGTPNHIFYEIERRRLLDVKLIKSGYNSPLLELT